MTSISINQSLRQRGSRYAIHAGRKLPDKEFRYLRTVKVTAAVYRRLKLAHIRVYFSQSAPGRRRTLCISVMLFTESCVFSKQSLPPVFNFYGLRTEKRPSFQRYRVKLQSSLAIGYLNTSWRIYAGGHKTVKLNNKRLIISRP